MRRHRNVRRRGTLEASSHQRWSPLQSRNSCRVHIRAGLCCDRQRPLRKAPKNVAARCHNAPIVMREFCRNEAKPELATNARTGNPLSPAISRPSRVSLRASTLAAASIAPAIAAILCPTSMAATRGKFHVERLQRECGDAGCSYHNGDCIDQGGSAPWRGRQCCWRGRQRGQRGQHRRHCGRCLDHAPHHPRQGNFRTVLWHAASTAQPNAPTAPELATARKAACSLSKALPIAPCSSRFDGGNRPGLTTPRR
mmetsp:Transcript_29827/g.81849  ORF Transcript_29827/g.81849 Transcript_29827/m.81849 type:complete len:254 (-) Transcript_29827:408-1169(-)